MALPAITKTWTFSVNNSLATTSSFENDAKQLVLALKNYLKSVGWTVKASCDSTSVPNYYDGVDRWVTIANIVWSGTVYGGNYPRSWIVLSAPAALSPTLEIMFACRTTESVLPPTTPKTAYIYSSWTGFSGGDTLTNPSAASYITHCNGTNAAAGYWMGANGSGTSAFSCVWHGATATDGTTRLVVCKNSGALFSWNFEKMACTSFTDNSAVFVSNGSQYAPAYTHWNDNAVFSNYSEANVISCYLTAEGYGAAMIGQNIISANDRGGGYWMGAVGLASASANQRGRQGTLADMWWGTTGLAYGTTVPDDGTKQFVQFNDMIFPWNGTTPLIA